MNDTIKYNVTDEQRTALVELLKIMSMKIKGDKAFDGQAAEIWNMAERINMNMMPSDTTQSLSDGGCYVDSAVKRILGIKRW